MTDRANHPLFLSESAIQTAFRAVAWAECGTPTPPFDLLTALGAACAVREIEDPATIARRVGCALDELTPELAYEVVSAMPTPPSYWEDAPPSVWYAPAIDDTFRRWRAGEPLRSSQADMIVELWSEEDRVALWNAVERDPAKQAAGAVLRGHHWLARNRRRDDHEEWLADWIGPEVAAAARVLGFPCSWWCPPFTSVFPDTNHRFVDRWLNAQPAD